MRLDDAPDVLTVPEAARLLRCGRNQLYDAIRRGDVPAVRIGRSLRVPRAGLLRMLGANPPRDDDAPAADRGVETTIATTTRDGGHERA
jgi:excisionase family DNA binding protein